MEKNLRIYEKVRNVPKEAQKEIKGGRMAGFTDINPMFRIKTLTEQFGPVGEGWTYKVVDRQFIPGVGGEISVFVDIELKYRLEETGEWSAPIPGTGGSMYVATETKGLRTDDEAPKKALTDALSVACKALGICADVYWDKDPTKYTGSENLAAASTPKQQTQQSAPNKPVSPFAKQGMATAYQVHEISRLTNDEQFVAILEKYSVTRIEDIPFEKCKIIIEKLKDRGESA